MKRNLAEKAQENVEGLKVGLEQLEAWLNTGELSDERGGVRFIVNMMKTCTTNTEKFLQELDAKIKEL